MGPASSGAEVQAPLDPKSRQSSGVAALSKLGKMLERDFRPEFTIDLALKDLNLVRAEVGPSAAPVAGAIAERWRGLVERGSRVLDVSAAARGLTPRLDAHHVDPHAP